jgi:metal-sulfur cluster biosynthetic enzyme
MDNVITNDKNKCRLALGALKEVMDPEIGLNIVDLGLLYQIDIEEESKEIFISMTLTTQFCPMGESIRSRAVSAVQQAFPEHAIHIEIVFAPHWTADRISAKGLEFLNR